MGGEHILVLSFRSELEGCGDRTSGAGIGDPDFVAFGPSVCRSDIVHGFDAQLLVSVRCGIPIVSQRVNVECHISPPHVDAHDVQLAGGAKNVEDIASIDGEIESGSCIGHVGAVVGRDGLSGGEIFNVGDGIAVETAFDR